MSFPRLAYINPQHARLSQIYQGPRIDDGIIRSMKKYVIPITRANYIEFAYGCSEDNLDAELEADLPEELQDWSRFQRKT